jgi:hypothetical protein
VRGKGGAEEKKSSEGDGDEAAAAWHGGDSCVMLRWEKVYKLKGRAV